VPAGRAHISPICAAVSLPELDPWAGAYRREARVLPDYSRHSASHCRSALPPSRLPIQPRLAGWLEAHRGRRPPAADARASPDPWNVRRSSVTGSRHPESGCGWCPMTMPRSATSRPGDPPRAGGRTCDGPALESLATNASEHQQSATTTPAPGHPGTASSASRGTKDAVMRNCPSRPGPR
jgi:hypothetical protein